MSHGKMKLVEYFKIFIFLAAFCCASLPRTNAHNILCLMITPSIGSQMWSDALFRALAAKGHHLTVVSPAPPRNYSSANMEHISLERVADVMQHASVKSEVMPDVFLGPFKHMVWYNEWHMQFCRGALESEGFKSIIKKLQQRPRAYKLIIYEATYGKSCLLSLANMLPDAPIVGVSAFKVTPDLLSAVPGAYMQPATVPYFTTDFTGVMSYWQRLQNSGAYFLAAFFKKFVANPVLEGLVFHNKPLMEAMVKPDLELTHRIKVMLVNSHQSVDHLQALPANVIEVGGLHIPKTAKPLPGDVQKFISRYPAGIVLVSLGAGAPPKAWGEAQIKMVIDVTERFPDYGFLWRVGKWGLKVTHQPNIFVAEWLPQNDILAHPKIRAFITHASHLNLQEAVHHGVPIVAVPAQFDEFNNAARVDELNIGVRVRWRDFTADNLYNALYQTANTMQLVDYVRNRKMTFGLRPQPPLETAVWWVEQLLENRASCDHLISQADPGYVVQHSWDIIFLMQFGTAMLMLNIYLVITQFFFKDRAREVIQKKKKKKKN